MPVSTLPFADRLSSALAVSKEHPMYAIAFDMDIESLRNNDGDPYNNAYLEIRRVLQEHGFNWTQGSVYFGGRGGPA